MSEPIIQPLALAGIRLDGGTQQRERLHADVVKEYAETMRDERWAWDRPGACPTVLFDGSTYWLIDGAHRVEAAKHAGLTELPCLVEQGTLQDAIWESTAANSQHGLRRTNKDKERATMTALTHPNAKNLPDRQIADHVGVSHTLVSQIAAELHASGAIDRARKNNGRKVNAARIGRGSPLKQLQQWWAQAPQDERHALRAWVLAQSE